MVSQFTIFALSSGHPPAGLAVIRVSGENAATSIEALTSRKADISRALVRANIHRPYAPSEVIDDGLFVWFKGPNSFTGEDCVEFHVHGGRAVIAAVLAALETFENYRMAEPGEFTRRAFDNGKLKNVLVSVKKEETISVPAGIFKCILVTLSSGDGSALLKNNGQMKIWFSADNQKIPVKIEQNTNIGTMILELKKVVIPLIEEAADVIEHDDNK